MLNSGRHIYQTLLAPFHSANIWVWYDSFSTVNLCWILGMHATSLLILWKNCARFLGVVFYSVSTVQLFWILNTQLDQLSLLWGKKKKRRFFLHLKLSCINIVKLTVRNAIKPTPNFGTVLQLQCRILESIPRPNSRHWFFRPPPCWSVTSIYVIPISYFKYVKKPAEFRAIRNAEV